MTDEIKRGPGRPRTVEVQQRRRRREGLEATRNLKLFVPESAKDPNFEHRWVTDRPGRVQYLTTQDDWDVVTVEQLGGDPDPSRNASEGTTMNRISNQTYGDKSVLLRKRKEFYEADFKKSQAAIDRTEDALRHKPPSDAEGLNGPEAYIPGGRNTISGR